MLRFATVLVSRFNVADLFFACIGAETESMNTILVKQSKGLRCAKTMTCCVPMLLFKWSTENSDRQGPARFSTLTWTERYDSVHPRAEALICIEKRAESL